MNRLQALRRRPRVLRDAEPHRGDRSRRRSCARSPTRTRSSPPRAARAQAPPRTRSAGATARTTAAPTGAGASTRTASSARVRVAERFGARPVTRQRALRGHDPPPPLRACATHEFRHRDRAGLRRPRRAAGACSAAGSCAAARARALPPRATTSATRPCRWPTRSARWSPSALGAAPDGPDPAAHAPAHASATASTRSASTTASTPTASALRGGRRRGHQHAVGRAPRLRAARRATARSSAAARQGAARLAVHGHGPALRVARARARRRRSSVHIESREDGERAFDATLGLRRRAAHAPRARARHGPLPGGDAAHARADLRPRGRAEAQGRPRPPHPARRLVMTDASPAGIVLRAAAPHRRRAADRASRTTRAPRVRLRRARRRPSHVRDPRAWPQLPARRPRPGRVLRATGCGTRPT